MEFYRAYNVNQTGETLAFKGFPAETDRDACLQALTLKENGHWHTMELWTGCDSVDCSELHKHREPRRLSLPTE